GGVGHGRKLPQERLRVEARPPVALDHVGLGAEARILGRRPFGPRPPRAEVAADLGATEGHDPGRADRISFGAVAEEEPARGRMPPPDSPADRHGATANPQPAPDEVPPQRLAPLRVELDVPDVGMLTGELDHVGEPRAPD